MRIFGRSFQEHFPAVRYNLFVFVTLSAVKSQCYKTKRIFTSIRARLSTKNETQITNQHIWNSE